MAKPVMIYFVQEGHDGPIKIGSTRQNLYFRISHMQCGNYRRLQVLGVINDQPPWKESRWHSRFSDCRLHGEWFAPTAGLMQAILQETEVPPDTQVPSPARAKLATRDNMGRDGWVAPRIRNSMDSGEAA